MALVPFGIAWGNINVGPVIAVTSSVAPQESGMILGATWTVFNIGTCGGLAITGTIFNHMRDSGHSFVDSFNITNWIIFGFCVLSFIYIVARMKLIKVTE